MKIFTHVSERNGNSLNTLLLSTLLYKMSSSGISDILWTNVSQTLGSYMYQNHLEDLGKHRLLGPILRLSDLVGMDWFLRICISTKFPGQATGRGPHFENPSCNGRAKCL